MFEGDVEGMKAAPCVSKAQVGDCIILCSASPTSHLAPAPPPCEMSKLLLNRQAPGSLPDPSPAAQLLPCAHSSEGPAAAFHPLPEVRWCRKAAESKYLTLCLLRTSSAMPLTPQTQLRPESSEVQVLQSIKVSLPWNITQSLERIK